MITEEQEAQISMFMRVVEFLRNNEDVFKEHQEMVNHVKELQEHTQLLLDLLTEEERDSILERYKDDMDYLNSLKEEEKL